LEGRSASDERIQKLEQVIRKGDAFAAQLERQGVDISSVRQKLDSAKQCFGSGEHQKAFALIQEFISDLNRLKESFGKDKTAPAKKGKGVHALIRDQNQMQQKVSDWKAIVDEWRGKGYQFEPDDTLFSHNFEEIEKRFITIGEQIAKAESIRDTIKGLRVEFTEVGKSYLVKIDDIEGAVFRLGRLDDLERRLVQLRGLLKSVDGRYKALRNRIQRHKRKGFITHTLEEMVDNDVDLDYIEKQFNIYEDNVEYLLKEKQKFQDLRSDPATEELSTLVREIEKVIDDPWMLDTIVEKMLQLDRQASSFKDKEKKRAEENVRRSEIRENLRKYRVEGFKVEMVEQLLDEDMNLLEEEYDVFIRNLARLKSLKEKLFTMDATDFEDEVSQIFTSMNDPSNIEVIENQINDLKERIKRHRLRVQKIENAIKQWSGMGFNVNKLEELYKKDLNGAEALMAHYEGRISKLMEIESKLQGLNVREMNDTLQKLTLKLKNPELYDSIIKDYSVIETRLNEYEGIREKRKELNDLLKVWKGQGYEIDNILVRMAEAKTVKDLQDILLKNTTAVATLETFKRKFQSEIRGWFREDEDFISSNINNPEICSEVLDRFQRLQEKNSREEQRRGVIARKLDEIDTKGIHTDKIRTYLTSETDTLTSEYEFFKEQVKRLIKLKASLLRDAYKNKEDSLKDKANSLSDPYKIDEYEAMITGKSQKVTLPAPATKEDLAVLLKKAQTAYKAGKMQEAMGFFDAILSLEPEHKEGSFYRKKILMKLRLAPPEPQKEEPKDPSEPEQAPSAVTPPKGDPNCISCGGNGLCSWCKGSGKCSTCNATGKYFGDTCTTCKGSGRCNVCDGKGNCSWCANAK
jgi:hypothetical protein